MYYTLHRLPLLAIALAGIQARPLADLEPRRFGQQNPQPVSNEVSNFPNGRTLSINGGVFGTLSGSIPGTLLGGSGACDQINLADKMVDLAKTNLTGKDQTDFINVARDFAHAEKNFNNFAAKSGVVCDDATLPKHVELRGVLPLQDPGVTGADAINAKTNQTLADIKSGKTTGPTGKSIAQQFIDLGFSNFTATNVAGTASDSGGATSGGASGGASGSSAAASTPATASTPTVSASASTATGGTAGKDEDAGQQKDSNPQNDPCDDNGKDKGAGGNGAGKGGGNGGGNGSGQEKGGGGGSPQQKTSGQQNDPCDDNGNNGNDKGSGGKGAGGDGAGKGGSQGKGMGNGRGQDSSGQKTSDSNVGNGGQKTSDPNTPCP